MKIYVFGNGNISFSDFKMYYEQIMIRYVGNENVSFLVGDFRGVDTLTMEFLKCDSANVTVYHVGDKPRYLPDKFKTKVNNWIILGEFQNDEERDLEAINQCTHFIAMDFNSDKKRKSGTQKNIEICEKLGKNRLLA
ncbi:MAG: hypothetical protein EAZ44_04895 [Cytophagia bacterium]|nr:MAG: hypothetical protein EAY69_01260 [Cytophagales bacterium]TAG04310.1 MAG: hypothetical protein EAZ44_04895 [Cytophagia bacterium]TAG38557.1 MAG: hypothetical protein EAZ31_10400 [Cytophagia bacterium]TAH30335.1 MAG: hypothetical protein EAZ06_03725 [Cytophagales bacterium]